MQLNNEEIGERIRTYRKLKRYSREKLAEELGAPVNHVSQMERGEITYIAEFVELCCILNLPLETFVAGYSDNRIDSELLLSLSDLSEQEKEVIFIVMRRMKKASEKS